MPCDKSAQAEKPPENDGQRTCIRITRWTRGACIAFDHGWQTNVGDSRLARDRGPAAVVVERLPPFDTDQRRLLRPRRNSYLEPSFRLLGFSLRLTGV